IELHRQSGVNLQRIISSVITEAAQRETAGLPKIVIAVTFEDALIGEFDPAAVAEAIKSITDDVRAAVSAKHAEPPSVIARRDRETNTAIIEWQNVHMPMRGSVSHGCGSIHTEVAKKIIEAHEGNLTCEPN